MLEKELTVNIHDIYPIEMLRMVSPEELVEAIKQNGLVIEDCGFGSEEGRVDFGDFTIDNHKIYYQVCGLFAGDEYLTFHKGMPKILVDKVLAILKLIMAKSMVGYHKREIGIAMSPGEVVAKMDDKLSSYQNKETNKAQEAINEAKEVLNGTRSFFNAELKDYKRAKTLGEALMAMTDRMLILDTILTERMKEKDETLTYLVKSYLNWKIKTTGFEHMYKSFNEKVRQSFEGLSTSPNRGWGPLSEKQQKEIAHLKKALSTKKLIETAIEEGDKILPELQQRLEAIK